MNDVYSTVRFRGEVAGSDMPEQFVIVTAYATTGENWTDMRNAAANERLRCELEQRAKWMREVTGYSPCDGHAEPGWAVDLGELEALALGRAFLQDAIFVVRRGELFVLSCAEDGEERSLGQFLARVDSAVEDASTGHGQHDCAQTIADADAGIAEWDGGKLDSDDGLEAENYGAFCEVEWGYELHRVELSPSDWEDIRDGLPVDVDGDGYVYEGRRFVDCWSFNFPTVGRLKVTYEEDDGVSVGYEGPWDGTVTVRTEFHRPD